MGAASELLHYRSARFEIVMATHHVAFDESGKEDRPYVVFVGLIALPEMWGRMNKKWNDTLHGKGLTHWRTASANNRDGQFKRFRGHDKEFNLLATEMAHILCEFADAGTINIIDNELLRNSNDAESQKQLQDPFYYAFEAGVRSLMTAPGIPSNDTFTMVCDDSPEAVNCLKAYKKMQDHNPTMAGRIGGICFHNDEMYPPVQAADLYAYCVRRELEKNDNGIWPELKRILDECFRPVKRTSLHK